MIDEADLQEEVDTIYNHIMDSIKTRQTYLQLWIVTPYCTKLLETRIAKSDRMETNKSKER